MFSFSLANIKSYIETDFIELKPITIFVGKNSSGKSSLIRFPVVLSQSFMEETYSPLLFFGKSLDYGNFDDIVYNHNGNTIKFSLRISLDQLKSYYSHPAGGPTSKAFKTSMGEFNKNYKAIRVDVSISHSGGRVAVSRFDMSFDDRLFASFCSQSRNKYSLDMSYLFKRGVLEKLHTPLTVSPKVHFDRFIPELVFMNREFLTSISLDAIKDHIDVGEPGDRYAQALVRIINAHFDGEMTIRNKIFDSTTQNDDIFDMLMKDNTLKEFVEATSMNIQFISTVLKALNRYMNDFSSRLVYIGPFRNSPERVYRTSENSMNNVGKNGENSSMLLLQAKKNKSPLLRKVSDWFLDSMGYRIDIEEIKDSNLFKVMVHTGLREKGNNLIDVGYGVAQVLPVITQAYFENKNEDIYRRGTYKRTGGEATIIVEQPELHLHPAAQANLANLFVEKVINEPNSKVLIETHSEHLIRRLQVLAADPSNTLTPADVAIYYVDKDDNSNSSVIRKMNINEKGQFIDKWPTGFFDKGYELSKELLRFAGKSDKS